MVNIGFIGCGQMGRDHIDRIANRMGNAHIVAIYDLNRAAAEKAVADFGLDAKICDSADELIHAPEVDAVVMASRNDAHLEPLLACIEAGKPVFTEKPMTIDGADSWKVVEAEVKAGKKLVQVGFNRRYDTGYEQMKEIIDSKQIGELLCGDCRHFNAQAATSYYRTDNVVNDTLIHECDILHYLFDDDYKAVEIKCARQNRLNPNGAENLREPQIAIIEFQHGAIVTVEANVNCQYGYDIQCRLVGESGTVSLPDVATPEVRQAERICHSISSDWFARFLDAYDKEMRAFLNRVERGEEPSGQMATAWDGYVANVAADAMLESLHNGGRVEISLPERPALYA